MRTFKLVPLAAILTSCLLGCSIGESEFTCSNGKGNGAGCSSPRDIHKLTNDRKNLEGLIVSDGQIIGEMNKDPNRRPIVDEDFAVFYDDEGRTSTQKVFTSEDGKQFVIQIDKKTGNEVYVPVKHKRYDTFPKAQLITPTSPTQPINNAVAGLNQEHTQQMMYHQTPMTLAPEPLAMRERPKNMRIFIPSWIDDKGDLHMPGYVYVEVTPKRWHAGEQANFRPGRIIPLQIQQQSQEEVRRQKESNSGLSSLGIKQ